MRKPIARHRARQRLEQRQHPRLIAGAGELLDRGHQADPLDPVAEPADERSGAGDRERRGDRCGEIGDPDRERRAEQQPAQPHPAKRREGDAADDHPEPPAGEQRAVPGVTGPERLLREHHLDRDHQREEDEGERLRGEQAPQRRALADVGEAVAQALGPRCPRLIGVGELEPASEREQRRHGQERRRVGEQRGLDPRAGDDDPGERRSAGRSDREGDVEQRIALAQLPGRREHRRRRRPRQRAGGGRERAVDDGERQHERERERVDGQRQQDEHARLRRVETGKREANGQPLDPGDQRGRDQRRGEVHRAEQPRGRDRAAGLVVDEDRERDLAQPVAELVDEVGEPEVGEPRQPKRSQRDRHPRGELTSALAPALQVEDPTCKFCQVL